MTKEPKHAVIIGAGVIGAACAYYLCRSGWAVTVIEKGGWGQGSSHGNCGLIVPSHVLPLNMPGVVWQGLQWMLKHDAPLYIKPRADMALVLWLLRFARRCNRRAMLQAAIARSAMLQGAMALFQDLIDKEALDCNWEAQGVLYVFRSRQALQSHRDINTLLKSFGEAGQALNQRELQALEPTLRQDLAGGYLHEKSAHLRPDFLMRELKRVLTSLGVRIQEQTTVTALLGQNGRVQEVATDRGSVSGDAFVVATGAWTPFLADELGCRIPIQPGKGYSATLPRPNPCPSMPCMLEEDRVVATPWPGGYRLGGTMEFTGYDDSLNPKRLGALYRGARRYFKPVQWAPVQEEWCGWRPMTFDGLPIIDRAPKWQNVMVAAGHNMLGISLAPGTGKLVCAMLNGDKPPIDPGPYRIGRWAGIF